VEQPPDNPWLGTRSGHGATGEWIILVCFAFPHWPFVEGSLNDMPQQALQSSVSLLLWVREQLAP
jgi:hypothetical protein